MLIAALSLTPSWMLRPKDSFQTVLQLSHQTISKEALTSNGASHSRSTLSFSHSWLFSVMLRSKGMLTKRFKALHLTHGKEALTSNGATHSRSTLNFSRSLLSSLMVQRS